MDTRLMELVPDSPACRLFALLSTEADVRGALAALSSHVDPAMVWVLSGEEGARALDVSGRARGFSGRFLRAVQNVAYDRGSLSEHEFHLRRGGHLLLVPARECAQCQGLVEVLSPWRPHGLTWFARYSVVDPTPRYCSA
ncbi:hypothetical protein SAMN05660209_00075 [Geodermatophilus africanus]|uniref:Uncharacterized protein n=1 Tax=Geodermatophilus africanus TaxID=1137993 RepID=A0A1H3AJC1_9ACTN|nr:hypothetical protein [Geodermatophilus africanus]SDX29820.1 hypothetical protein SAMN05660209_00075 [Geodermatophilus africanus]